MTLLAIIKAKALADPAFAAIVATQDTVAITAALNAQAGTRLQSRMISERGIRDHLSVPHAGKLIRVLRSISEAESVPSWLSGVLASMGVPESAHIDYFETLQCGYTWLRSDGLDVGSARVQQLLDLIAAGQPECAEACVAAKALGRVPSSHALDTIGAPVTEFDVRCAVFADDGAFLA